MTHLDCPRNISKPRGKGGVLTPTYCRMLKNDSARCHSERSEESRS